MAAGRREYFCLKNENWLLCKEAAGRWRVYFLLFFSFCTVISKQVAVTAVRSELFWLKFEYLTIIMQKCSSGGQGK